LIALTDAVEVAAATMRSSAPDDRLAGSYPFLTMCAVMTAGWLVERMARSQGGNDRVRAASDFFLANVVPEALGLGAAAEAGAAQLYSIAAEALA
jgi:hypothetical protein